MGKLVITSPSEFPTADQVLDLIGLEPESLGMFAKRPAVGVALDGRPAEAALSAVARHLPVVLIGVARTEHLGLISAELDVMLTTQISAPAPWIPCAHGVDQTLDELLVAIEKTPIAAITLAQTLRIGETLSLDDALVVESLAYGVLQAGPEHRNWLTQQSKWKRPVSPGESVLTSREASALIITLNRPRLQNSYDSTMRDALVEALRIPTLDSSIATVVLRGAGPSFCIGGDLREFGSTPDPATAHLVRTACSPAPLLAACAPRLTACIRGHCIGAGIELAAFARVIAAADTTIWLPELSMGLIPGAGGTVSLPRRIGRARAAFLVLSGSRLDVATALKWGLVDEIDT